MTEHCSTQKNHSRYILIVLIITFVPALVIQAETSNDPFLSHYPSLDQAAKALAQGQLDVAIQGFEAVTQDAQTPSFVRGLALFGIAEVAQARQDQNTALATWERLAADASLLQFQRDTARRRIAEVKRLGRGLPARDPASYRVQLPALPAPAVQFYVAPTGNDTGDGSQKNPFRTLERARDAIRSLKQAHSGSLPKGGIRIMIGGGKYFWDRTLELTSEDSGTADSPIIYQSAPGRSAVFHGGVTITGWKPISDTKLRARLDTKIRDRVLQADLQALGIEDLGDATELHRCPELFVDGQPQTLARWPNEGFVKIGDIRGKDIFKKWEIEGCRDGKFSYIEDRPNRWLDEPDVRLYGYWFFDWLEEFQKVASIDPDTQTFTLAQPYSRYGYRKGQRYYALNIFRELDTEGEWYLDRRTATIYWLPRQDIETASAQTVLSVFDQSFIKMTDVRHVILSQLTLQEGRGNGIHISGGSDCRVDDCTIRRLGGDAVVVEGGIHHGIFGCTMHTLGCGGMCITGGDLQKLTPGRHYVENCHVFNISRLKRTYTPAVRLDGCGNRITHNLFENMPSSSMRINGNDHLIELNVIRKVVKESDDQGGLDMWGNPLYRGVVIRWNLWSDITGGTATGAAGVRLDDMISGVTVYGNIFQRCGAVHFGGVQIHGGKENLIDGNLFLDCHSGLSFTSWAEKRWLEAIERFLPQAGSPSYVKHYPELTSLKIQANVNFVSRNAFIRCDSIFLRRGQIQQTALNAVIDPSLEQILMAPGQKFLGDVALLKPLLFEPIPLHEIGPYESN
ncbi:MAG: right-handed parallel beta-helix repeat-containing protein [Sedimentisphaerales bacterium]|nr:right-handed parallel beta-helix repeat-containing protein [Sedimentisphaerales bacterium]